MLAQPEGEQKFAHLGRERTQNSHPKNFYPQNVSAFLLFENKNGTNDYCLNLQLMK